MPVSADISGQIDAAEQPNKPVPDSRRKGWERLGYPLPLESASSGLSIHSAQHIITRIRQPSKSTQVSLINQLSCCIETTNQI